MCIACWMLKATNTQTRYVILIAFPLQHWLHESALLLFYTYIVCLVNILERQLKRKDRSTRTNIFQCHFIRHEIHTNSLTTETEHPLTENLE